MKPAAIGDAKMKRFVVVDNPLYVGVGTEAPRHLAARLYRAAISAKLADQDIAIDYRRDADNFEVN